MTVTVYCVGDLREEYLRAAASEYEKRLSAFCSLKTVVCKDDAALRSALQAAKGYLFALCIEGKQLSSEEFSEKLEALSVGGTSHIGFVIGGSDGLTEEHKALCAYRLSFSKMTFPHRIARILLLEQLYRAFSIRKGTRYHK